MIFGSQPRSSQKYFIDKQTTYFPLVREHPTRVNFINYITYKEATIVPWPFNLIICPGSLNELFVGHCEASSNLLTFL